VVPTDYDGYWVSEINASFGDAWPTVDSAFVIELRDPNNQVISQAAYTHDGNNRHVYKLASTSDLQPYFRVNAGWTLNVLCVSQNQLPGGQSGQSKGYTVTIKLQLQEPTP